MSSENNDRAVRVLGKDGFEQPSEITLDRTVKATTTQQADTDDHQAAIEWYDPPFDPEELLLLLQRSETHQACVEAKAKGVAGHGFEIVPHDSVDPDSVGEVPDTIREFWHEGTFQLGPGALYATADEVNENAWNDHEGVGWLAIEVLVNPNDGMPTGLAHVPSYTIRKRKDDTGYVQVDNGIPSKYFATAGDRYGDDKTFVDSKTGKTADNTGPIDDIANELIVLRNYTAGSPHYGLPDIIPAMETLAGDLAAREFNQRFFSNDTVPRLAVTVSGGELTERAWKDLEQTFRDLRKEKNAHRGVLIEATSAVANSIGDAAGVNIDIEPLTVGVDEDAGFTQYRDNNEHYILQAHGVPPVVAGRTENVNYANAKSQRVNFAQTVIKPKQKRLAERLYKILHVGAFEEPGWTIEFNLHGGENRLRDSEIAANRLKAASGTLTINEARSELGFEALDGAEGEVLVATLKKAMNPTGSTEIEEQPAQDQGNEGPPSDDAPTRRMLLNKASAQFKEGDVVEYGDGYRGVVVGVKTSDFEAPTEEGETIEVEEGETIYVVARESGGFGYFEPRELTRSEFDSESSDPEELKESMEKAQFDLPEGWTRATLLDAWSSMGASFSGCMETFHDEEMCGSMKDTVYGTTYWR